MLKIICTMSRINLCLIKAPSPPPPKKKQKKKVSAEQPGPTAGIEAVLTRYAQGVDKVFARVFAKTHDLLEMEIRFVANVEAERAG